MDKDLTLSIQELSVQVGARSILGPLSIQVRRGRWVSVLGKNGSGKTTLLKELGFWKSPSVFRSSKTKGSVKLLGEDLETFSIEQKSQLLFYLPSEIHCAFPVSVKEWIQIGKRRVKEDCFRDKRILDELKIRPLMTRDLGTLSGGESQRVHLAMALMRNPSVLLLSLIHI